MQSALKLFNFPRRFSWSLIVALGTLASAQTQPQSFIPFNTFLDSVKSTDAFTLSRRVADVNLTTNVTAIDEMRQSILKRYEGVQVTHSYVRDGITFDCVPLAQQPAMRTYHLTAIAEPPPQELLKNTTAVPQQFDGNAIAQLNAPAARDAFGNVAACDGQTVALQRFPLETLMHFHSLSDFYQKSPGESAHLHGVKALQSADPHAVNPAAAAAAHKYSVVYQIVNNLGGLTNENLWAPHVDTTRGEVFSLTQAWYIGGSGSGTQTEEIGWVVFPQLFNDENPHLFIFSTADNYQTTGCWNNSCGDFVQLANAPIGYSLLPVSTYGGAQYAPSFRYYLWQGNWWAAYNGQWLGYYPGSKYKGGQNSHFAQLMEFGTETVGTWDWPGAGSGLPPTYGFGYGAFQYNVSYQGLDNVLHPASLSILGAASCYGISGPFNNGGNGGNTYFYDGGFGGTSCN